VLHHKRQLAIHRTIYLAIVVIVCRYSRDVVVDNECLYRHQDGYPNIIDERGSLRRLNALMCRVLNHWLQIVNALDTGSFRRFRECVAVK
jgi:hypothetical protein